MERALELVEIVDSIMQSQKKIIETHERIIEEQRKIIDQYRDQLDAYEAITGASGVSSRRGHG